MSVSPRQRSRTKCRERETIPLMVPRESGLRASSTAFWKLCVANPLLRLERSANGEVIVMAPAGSDSGMRNASVSSLLWIWNRSTKLGVVFDSSAGFRLPNGSIAAADAAWIKSERWETVSKDARKRFAPICPDFVVEIVSPSDSTTDLRKKMMMYLDQGVRLGWLLDPCTGLAEIYRPGRPVETLARPATLSGEDVLPGFVLDLQGILFD